MPPNARQIRCYQHKCDVWRATRGANGYETWALISVDRICLYQFTPNVSDVIPGIGRVKRTSEFTNDTLHFVADENVKETDIVINRTILPDGTRSRMWGVGHRLLGDSQMIESSGGRRANKQSFPAQVEEQLPDGVG